MVFSDTPEVGQKRILYKGLHPGQKIVVLRITPRNIQYRFTRTKTRNEGNRYSAALDWIMTNSRATT